MIQESSPAPVALVTGAARRIGAAIIRQLHGDGARVIVHYRNSADQAQALVAALNDARDDSAHAVQADLADTASLDCLVDHAAQRWGRLDVLVNNASSFYPTPIGALTEAAFDDLIASNLKGPLFLAQAATPHLRRTQGSIVNLIDIYAQRPNPEHTAYCAAKAGLAMATRSLALELAPDVRVNGVAPGAILAPEGPAADPNWADGIPAARPGTAEDIARAVAWLAGRQSAYVTGQILAVDGGKSQV